ncbi:hypothetical protein, partial [Stenotrophomonas maltophilia]|uniref:hypothetical protein n=1 Tax=Stenotrophomonas maltophilia TaxID=40324 RepID=UPI00313DD5B6
LNQLKANSRECFMSNSTVSTKSHRYELVHGEGADFVAYQLRREDGRWQTFATWMIPRAICN